MLQKARTRVTIGPVKQSQIGAPERVAPGPLLLVQDFLNAPSAAPTEDELRVAEEIRRAGEAGEAQPALAARYGASQQLISAILRGKRHAVAATLGTAELTRDWLASRGLLAAGDQLADEDRMRLLELQDSLLDLALANAGGSTSDLAMASLDRLASQAVLRATFDKTQRPKLVPVGGGVQGTIATILAVVYDAMRDGTWSRLKACPADRCHWVFYDASRNGTSTWCSMAICGNRTKVRNYQERRRAARSP